jgi:hypothetical protein
MGALPSASIVTVTLTAMLDPSASGRSGHGTIAP